MESCLVAGYSSNFVCAAELPKDRRRLSVWVLLGKGGPFRPEAKDHVCP